MMPREADFQLPGQPCPVPSPSRGCRSLWVPLVPRQTPPAPKHFPGSWEWPLSIFAQESGSGEGVELGYSPWRTAGEDKLTCAGGWGSGKVLLSLRLEPQRSWGSKGAADPPFQPLPRDGVGASLGSAYPEVCGSPRAVAAISKPGVDFGVLLCPLRVLGQVPAARIADPRAIPCSSRGCGHGGTSWLQAEMSRGRSGWCRQPQTKWPSLFQGLTPRILTWGLGSLRATLGQGISCRPGQGIKQPLAPSPQPARGTQGQPGLAGLRGAARGERGWQSRAQERPGPCPAAAGVGTGTEGCPEGLLGLSPCHLSPFPGSHL